MTTDFHSQYAAMADEELLSVAADRQDLVEEAAFTLDAEMRQRGLNYEQARTFKRNLDRINARDSARGRAKQDVRNADWDKLGTLLIALVVVAVYSYLPAQLKLPDDWQQPGLITLVGTTFGISVYRSSWRRASFWLALPLSIVVQLYLAHTLILHSVPFTDRSRSAGKAVWVGTAVVGFLVWVVVLSVTDYIEARRKKDQQ